MPFLDAGTAVGVAAAFGAPIGGLLFAYEELATFFSQTLGWEVFFACMLSVLTEDTLRSAQNALTEGNLGLFDGEASTIFFEVSGVSPVRLHRLVVSSLPDLPSPSCFSLSEQVSRYMSG